MAGDAVTRDGFTFTFLWTDAVNDGETQMVVITCMAGGPNSITTMQSMFNVNLIVDDPCTSGNAIINAVT